MKARGRDGSRSAGSQELSAAAVAAHNVRWTAPETVIEVLSDADTDVIDTEEYQVWEEVLASGVLPDKTPTNAWSSGSNYRCSF